MDINRQKLLHFYKENLLETYDVSTSRNPPSCMEGSNGTPDGFHKIDGKIGEDAPLDMVFRGRKESGRLSEQSPEELQKNLICARIMRLRGLEEGKNSGGNRDTYDRYVYIHGTNQEDKIGTPNSHGCVLMRNAEVAKLFELVPNGTIVLICGI